MSRVSFPHLTAFEDRALQAILRAWEAGLIEADDAERAIEVAARVSLRRIEQARASGGGA